MFNTTTNSVILQPDQVEALLVEPALLDSVAAQVSTVLRTERHRVRFPKLTSDPVAHWTEEGAEITPSDPTFDEVTAEPAKLAGLVIASNEALEDSDPAILNEIGNGLVRQITNAMDAAFFNDLPSPAPAGLASIEPTELAVDGALKNLDWAEEAISLAASENSAIATFVANPKDALALALLKESSGSNRGLLQSDPTAGTVRNIAGVRLLSTTHVPAGTIWALPQNSVHTVVRKQAEVKVDGSVMFTSDRAAFRGVMRVGFAFTHEAGIVKITHASA